MDVEIYEGERFLATDNHFLGKFILSGIPPAKRGQTPIQDTYEIDANGILKVTATVLASGSSRSLTITNNSRLSDNDAKKIASDAAKFREEDAMHEERLMAFNAFEGYLYEIKRKVKNLKSEVEQREAKEVLDNYSTWFRQNQSANKEEFENKKCELEELWNQMQR